MTDPRFGDHLQQVWDAVLQGEALPAEEDLRLGETIQTLVSRDHVPPPDPAFVAQVREELTGTATAVAPPPSADRSMPNGHAALPIPLLPTGVPMPRPRWARSRWVLAQLATAALLIVTLEGSYFAFGPGWPRRPDDPALLIPALSATPLAETEVTTETLLDVSSNLLPDKRAIFALKRLTLQPGPNVMTILPVIGLVFLVMQSGELVATANDVEHHLGAGETFATTAREQPVDLRATGGEEAVALLVYLQSDADVPFPRDAVAHALEVLSAESVEAMPNGVGRITLDKLTLAPASEPSPLVVGPLERFAVGEGRATIAAESEQLPYQWTSGAEQSKVAGVRLPTFAPGTRLSLRNPEQRPLVLYRLGLRPRTDLVAAPVPTVGEPSVTLEAAPTETLIDTTLAALPAGRNRVAVDRWRLQPSPSQVRLPAYEGLVLLGVVTGEVTVTVNGSERRLAAGDVLDVTNQEFLFRASGSAEAIAYAVYVTPSLNLDHQVGQAVARLWLDGDHLVHAMDFVISSSADDLPGGSARLLLERLTLPPRTALPPTEAGPLVWTQVGSGELWLTLEGERLPYRWASGEERRFHQFGRVPLPFLAPGTKITMRNAGNEPLVLYRLTLAPGDGAEGDAAAP
jgi:hypothetical protein